MKLDIIRAWKDETYRQSLDEEQFRALPENPAGDLELTDADLQLVSGRGGLGEGFGFPGLFGGVGEFGGGIGGFGCGGGFCGSDFENHFFNSCACVCENAIFSNNHVRNVVHSAVRVTNICVNFN